MEIPGLTIIFGLAGALAVVAVSARMAHLRIASWLAYCGRHSLVIYLGFVSPMAATRLVLMKSGIVANVGWISRIVVSMATAAPLVFKAATRSTPLAFLFRRPAWARLEHARGGVSIQLRAIGEIS